MIPVYYRYNKAEEEYDVNTMELAGKEFYDKMGGLPSGANGEDGMLYAYCAGEPYNYYSEISDAMENIECYEAMESVFECEDKTVDEIIRAMAEQGFELLPMPE